MNKPGLVFLVVHPHNTTHHNTVLCYLTPVITGMDEKMYRYMLSIMMNTHLHTAGPLTTVHSQTDTLTFSEVMLVLDIP